MQTSKTIYALLICVAALSISGCGRDAKPQSGENEASGAIQQTAPETSSGEASTTVAQSATPATTGNSSISVLFPQLKTKSIEDIGGEKVYFDPKLTELLNGKHPQEKEYDEAGAIVTRVLRSELLGKGKGYFIVDCDSGPSGDPSCTFTRDGEEKGTNISGLNFILPGNGNIYATGHINTMFNERKKYEWRAGQFVEVKQPYHYVGLDSTTNRAIQIYDSRQYKKSVASLPANSPVTVLINEDDDYLVKTPFGLVGWIRISSEESSQENTPIKGIYFSGD